ncbi:alpha-amylase family protein [Paenibacillus xerothermodurans]|uniref:Beta-galactosidase n=1 Tax=Paenibacillus xerothermodurans TaxID=1977292 RepID=A0A2W1NCA8_PAEXE|nr:alpha-amylase family protein [Paenibacillus xerothermodurans]PZE22329.1 beta-galactosidase [Paenibacillus xerothermodurans]
MSTELRFRQVHLDFHTSPEIAGIGEEFDAEQFAATLEKARVNSIACFARCHHGMLYYDSQLNPERVHPNLKNKNLLKEQIDACHSRGIRAPIYITVQWDHFTAEQHPEWIALDEHGNAIGTPVYEPGFYRHLCVNTAYRDFLKQHTKELLDMFEVDGIFYDIVKMVECSCKQCRADMLAQGLDPSRSADRLRFATEMMDDFKRDMSAFIRQYNTECTIFYNKGHIGVADKPAAGAFTHFELESLPSGGWGYMHFPLAMRYARTLGHDCLGMTGKFHTSWGDFHSFKNQVALEFECFNMLSLNAKCSIGDQLDPSGKISAPVYDLIGAVYSQVEQKEPWCAGARAVTDIGLFTPEEFSEKELRMPPAAVGAARMLQESAHQFDIIDSKTDFSRYKVLILPDNIPVSAGFAQKLDEFAAAGGAVIASFESGLNADTNELGWSQLGIDLKPDPTRDEDGNLVRGVRYFRNDYTDYILPQGTIGEGLPDTEHAMHMKGVEVQARSGTEVLAMTVRSHFDRSYRHFCSHRQSPSSGKPDYAGIVKNGNVIYFAHPIFSQYHQNAPRWCKQLFLNALRMVLPEQVLTHSGPSTMLATVNEQSAYQRWVVHLLHYIPERRSADIDIIEDVIPVHGIKVRVRTDNEVVSVSCVPEQQPLPFTYADGHVEFELPKLNGHQMISIQY